MTQQSTANSAHQWCFFFLSRDRVPAGGSLPHKSPLTYFWSIGKTGAIKDCLERLNEPLCWWFKGIVFLLSLCLSSICLGTPEIFLVPTMSQFPQNLNLNIKILYRKKMHVVYMIVCTLKYESSKQDFFQVYHLFMTRKWFECLSISKSWRLH